MLFKPLSWAMLRWVLGNGLETSQSEIKERLLEIQNISFKTKTFITLEDIIRELRAFPENAFDKKRRPAYLLRSSDYHRWSIRRYSKIL
jgi:hypothetical protein